MTGLLATLVCPSAAFARVWVGADVGIAGGPLAGTSPLGVYAGYATRTFPVGGELSYQMLSVNPARVGLFSATAVYRRRLAAVRHMHYLVRAGVAYVHGDGSFVQSSTRPLIGAGISYRVARHVDLRAEYDLIISEPTAAGPSENGNELLAGVTYRFARR
ncbi:MAG: outer membrane protein [Acidiferrobacter sp.]